MRITGNTIRFFLGFFFSKMHLLLNSIWKSMTNVPLAFGKRLKMQVASCKCNTWPWDMKMAQCLNGRYLLSYQNNSLCTVIGCCLAFHRLYILLCMYFMYKTFSWRSVYITLYIVFVWVAICRQLYNKILLAGNHIFVWDFL